MAEEPLLRRTFLATFVAWFCSFFLFALAACGLRFVFDFPRSQRGTSRKVRIAAVEDVPAERPLRVIVEADRWDAYVHHPPGPIGTVWLTWGDQTGQSPGVRCFQAMCPHLGCGIDYAADRGAFVCPCHVSEFTLDGARKLGPSPRGMDELPVSVTEPDADGKRWVEIEYAEFQTGVAEAKPL